MLHLYVLTEVKPSFATIKSPTFIPGDDKLKCKNMLANL